MLVGMNLPWGVYGHTFGHDFRDRTWTPLLDRYGGRELMLRRLDLIAEVARARLIRFWCFTNLEGCALERDVPSGVLVGLGPLPDRTLENLEWFCAQAVERDLLLYPCFGQFRGDSYLDVQRYLLPFLLRPGAQLPYQGIQEDGVGALCERVIAPLARLLGGFAEHTFGLDLYNEPEELVRAPGANPAVGQTDWATVQALLGRMAATVRSVLPGLKLSVGSGWSGFRSLDDGRFDELGLDRYDVHAYALRPSELRLPQAWQYDRPLVLGEFGSHLYAGGPPCWLATAEVQLFHAAERGYEAALFWQDDDLFRLERPQLRQLGRLTESVQRYRRHGWARDPHREVAPLAPGRTSPWRRRRRTRGPKRP